MSFSHDSVKIELELQFRTLIVYLSSFNDGMYAEINDIFKSDFFISVEYLEGFRHCRTIYYAGRISHVGGCNIKQFTTYKTRIPKRKLLTLISRETDFNFGWDFGGSLDLATHLVIPKNNKIAFHSLTLKSF